MTQHKILARRVPINATSDRNRAESPTTNIGKHARAADAIATSIHLPPVLCVPAARDYGVGIASMTAR